MGAYPSPQQPDTCMPPSTACQLLERGELLYFPQCPFDMFSTEDRQFLFGQELGSALHKNISFDPATGRVTGYGRNSRDQVERLRQVLADFSRKATGWLAATLPAYAPSWRLDRVSFRPEEEATRNLRLKARNDLLHVDAFPSRPTQGQRILRLFVNLSVQEPRVWMTSDSFAKLLARYGAKVGLPSTMEAGWLRSWPHHLLGIFQPHSRLRTPYDRFMLRFHDFLKSHEEFQERGPKRFWSFAPGSAWLLFSDTLSYADLRGRFALDHSFFVAPHALLLPEESPAVLLERACGVPVLERAA